MVFNDHLSTRHKLAVTKRNQYRTKNLTLILALGLDYWYDRNWSVALKGIDVSFQFTARVMRIPVDYRTAL